MPALIFLGRKCRVGSDDFYYPTLFCIFYQVSIILFNTAFLIFLKRCSSTALDKGGITFWFVLWTCPILLFIISVEFIILHISSKGSIVNCEHRILMGPTLIVHLFTTFIEFALGITGIVLYSFFKLCQPDKHYLMVVSTALFLDVFSTAAFFCCFVGKKHVALEHRSKKCSHQDTNDPYHQHAIDERQSLVESPQLYEDNKNLSHEIYTPHQERWQRKCNWCCWCLQCFTCNLFGGGGTRHDNDSMSVVAGVLARLFYGNPDLVLSDIVAGFVLLGAVQAHEADYPTTNLNAAQKTKSDGNDRMNLKVTNTKKISAEEVAEVDDISIFIEKTTEDNNTSIYDINVQIKELATFSKYAIGIYGWMLYFWSNPWTGALRLLFSCRGKRMNNVLGDNMFFLHMAAFLQETGLKEKDIIYAQFSNNVCQPAFCVAVDHEQKAVVVSIRGTLSLEDCLTDVIAHSCPLDETGVEYDFDGSGGFAHQGMLNAAKWLMKELNSLSVLEALLEGRAQNGCLADVELPNCSLYTLVITGHSMGAGTAILLAMMLKPKFNRIKCYAFSPPGCILSLKHAESCQNYVTSVVVGKDIIARASLPSMYRLRDKVLDLIHRSKVNKKDILNQVISWHNPEELLHQIGQEDQCPFGQKLSNYRSMLNRLMDIDGTQEMYIPGRIVHLTQDGDFNQGYCFCCLPGRRICCTSRVDYNATWSDRSSFTTVRVSRTMLDDHFPDKVHYVLQDVAKRL